MIYVGIDVAKDFHECTIISQCNDLLLPCFSISNTQSGFQQLYDTINKISDGNKSSVKIGLESTGHYSANLLNFLSNSQFEVVCLNALSVLNYKKSQSLRKTKTDRSDSRSIAEILMSDKSRPYSPQNNHIAVLKSLTRARYRTTKHLQRIKGCYRRSVQLLFPELSTQFSNLYLKTALNFVAKYPGAKEVANTNITSLKNFLRTQSHGIMSEKKALEIKNAAKNSIAIYNEGDSLELKLLAEQIIYLQEQRNVIETKINIIMTEINSPIVSIPGIGNILGATILAEIGCISNFDSPAKLQAFSGTDPAIYQSGKFNATNTPMVKRGSAFLRHAIYLATCMAHIASLSFSTYINKKIAQGKHYFVAISHGMKKMIRVIFHVLTTGNCFVEPVI